MKKKGGYYHNLEKVIKMLKENSGGIIIYELAKKTGASRQIIANCFAFLESARKVEKRQTGMVKIYFWINKEDKNE